VPISKQSVQLKNKVDLLLGAKNLVGLCDLERFDASSSATRGSSFTSAEKSFFLFLFFS
jgi:hypothetical protein